MSLSHARPKILGLVLAAGRGRRFDPSGRQQKLAAHLPGGEPVLRASCRHLLPWVDSLVVVTGPHTAPLQDLLADLAVRTVVCPDPDPGLGASLAAGLAATDPALGWIIALGDMPFVAPATYSAVKAKLLAGAQAVRPVWEGAPGHPVGVAAALRNQFAGISPEQGLAPLLKSAGVSLTKLPVQDPGCVRDVDVPADLVQSS